MTSRSTQQAARAYQKAHGVPYTEALRRVTSPDTRPVDPKGELPTPRPGEHRISLVGGDVTPLDPLQTAQQTDWLHRMDGAALTLVGTAADDRPVYVDPSVFARVGEVGPSGVIAGTPAPPDAREVDEGPIPTLRLGTFTPVLNENWHTSALDMRWDPAVLITAGHRAALGVYSDPEDGRQSVELATFVRTFLDAPQQYRILLVTQNPEAYPDHPDVEYVTAPEILDRHMGTGTVVVYDDPDLDEDPTLVTLLRTARSRGAVVLYSGRVHEDDTPAYPDGVGDVTVKLRTQTGRGWLGWNGRRFPRCD